MNKITNRVRINTLYIVSFIVIFLSFFAYGAKASLAVTQLPAICGVAPNLVSPAVGAELSTNRPVLDWTDVSGKISYTIQVSAMSDFSKLLVNTNVFSSKYTTNTLPRGVVYYWRVKTNYRTCSSDWIWAKKWKFYIIP